MISYLPHRTPPKPVQTCSPGDVVIWGPPSIGKRAVGLRLQGLLVRVVIFLVITFTMTFQISSFFGGFYLFKNVQSDLLNFVIIFEPVYIFTGKFSLGSGRKKDRMRIRSIPDIFARGALVWNVQASNTFCVVNVVSH